MVCTAQHNAQRVQTQAQRALGDTLVRVDSLLDRYQLGLAGVRGALALTGVDGMDRAAFLRYSASQHIAQDFPGARGFGFIRRVAPAQSAAYIAARRRRGWPDFALRQFRPHAGERALVELVEPIDANRAAIGLDIASDPVRFAAATAAAASSMATLTAPITLEQDRARAGQAFLLFLPVVEAGTVVGWSYAPLLIEDVLAHLPASLPDGAFSLADTPPGGAPARFFAAGTGAPDVAVVHQRKPVLGRAWTASFQPSAAFVAQLHLPSPLHAGIAGISLTLLCALLGGMLATQGARLRRLYASQEQQVIDRTAELESARRKLRTILDAVPSMIGYWDAHQRNQFANRACCDWFGVEAEQLDGRAMQEVLSAEQYDMSAPCVEAALRGERTVMERATTGRDGVMRYYLAVYLPDIGASGVQGFYTLVHDVSEVVEGRQALASVLRENDALVRTINEQMLYSVTDPAGFLLEVNDNFCTTFGYTREELIGTHHGILSSGQHDAAFWDHMRQTVLAGRTWTGIVCNRAQDGSDKWFDTVVAPHFDQHGVIERYVGLQSDVTARRAADTALRHVSALLGNVLQAASEMSVIATDAEGLITVFNAGAERMLGYAASEVVGHSTPTPFHDSAELVTRAAELHALTGIAVEGLRSIMLMVERNGAESREWTYVRKDGSRFPVLLTVTSIRDDSGAVLGYLGIGVDISQRKHDDAILHESIHRAEQASIAKSQFMANMSHEIRTPMNAMLGMLELMLRTELSARQHDYVEKARRAGTTLLALLNDVLDFSKIDAGKFQLDEYVFERDALLHDLETVLTGNCVNKQVEIVFDIAPTIPARLRGDRQRLHQVLVNLAGNALKFTPAGQVVVAMTTLAADPATISVRCAVSDTGIGIPASQLGMIFDGFTQAEASTARRFGGTGLGLAISARIVALMGGTLQVSSVVGRGSCFWFDITLATVADAAALPAVVAPLASSLRPQRLAGLHVLVVEDNALNRQVAFELISAEGALVDLAEGGEQGVAMALASALDSALDPAHAYDAIIMDVQMPDVDGLEATRRIRAVPGLAQLPIMAMTANVAPADRAACLVAGMDSHIGKPFDIDQVVARLSGLMGRRAAPLVDLAGALPRFFDDAALYQRMLAKFGQESGQLFARLEGEQAQDDAGAEAATRHALKGMALTMGLPRLAHALAGPAGAGSGHASLRALAAVSIQAARSALAEGI